MYIFIYMCVRVCARVCMCVCMETKSYNLKQERL